MLKVGSCLARGMVVWHVLVSVNNFAPGRGVGSGGSAASGV